MITPIFNPFTLNFDFVGSDEEQQFNYFTYVTGTTQSIDGSGDSVLQIDIPHNSAMMVYLTLFAKHATNDEYYIEFATQRLYRPAAGNPVNMSGGTTAVSENFATNPSRSIIVTGGKYNLVVSSGGLQTINWEARAAYTIKQF